MFSKCICATSAKLICCSIEALESQFNALQFVYCMLLPILAHWPWKLDQKARPTLTYATVIISPFKRTTFGTNSKVHLSVSRKCAHNYGAAKLDHSYAPKLAAFTFLACCVLTSPTGYSCYYGKQGHHHNGYQAARRPHVMCSIYGRRFTTTLFGVRGDRDELIQ